MIYTSYCAIVKNLFSAKSYISYRPSLTLDKKEDILYNIKLLKESFMVIKKHYTDVKEKPVNMDGAKNTTIRWLIAEKDGAKNYAMRLFELEKDGNTPEHSHNWEHEVFVLSGKGALVDENGREHPLEPGKFAYVKPNELHQFKNKGDEDFIFLCIIPLP